MTHTFTRDGIPQIDARNNVYYMAAGNSPAMMAKNVGQGSQYLWAYRDATGEFLQGDRKLPIPGSPESACQQFLVCRCYDALSRSELQNGQPFPSVSSYTKPIANSDGSVEIVLVGRLREKSNWIKTVQGHGWFPIFRFYGASRSLFRQDLETA